VSNLKIDKKGVLILRSRFIGGLTAGLLIGAAASIMMVPQMDPRTRRRLDRTSRRWAHNAGNIINDLRDHSW
jgi:gas vesicle protein